MEKHNYIIIFYTPQSRRLLHRLYHRLRLSSGTELSQNLQLAPNGRAKFCSQKLQKYTLKYEYRYLLCERRCVTN